MVSCEFEPQGQQQQPQQQQLLTTAGQNGQQSLLLQPQPAGTFHVTAKELASKVGECVCVHVCLQLHHCCPFPD